MKKIDIYSDTSAYVIGSLGFNFFCLAVPVTPDGDFGDVFDITWCRNSNAGVDVSL